MDCGSACASDARRLWIALALGAALLLGALTGWELARPLVPFASTTPAAAPFDWRGDETLRVDGKIQAAGPSPIRSWFSSCSPSPPGSPS
jgi:hypothetical protein